MEQTLTKCVRSKLTCPAVGNVVQPHTEHQLEVTGCCQLWVPDQKGVNIVMWHDRVHGSRVEERLEAKCHVLQKHFIVACTKESKQAVGTLDAAGQKGTNLRNHAKEIFLTGANRFQLHGLESISLLFVSVLMSVL